MDEIQRPAQLKPHTDHGYDHMIHYDVSVLGNREMSLGRTAHPAQRLLTNTRRPAEAFAHCPLCSCAVSTGDQTVENEERELQEVAAAKGWEVAYVYRDEGISGAKARDKRLGLDAALKDAVRGRYGVLMA